jgi:hypothetical protein
MSNTIDIATNIYDTNNLFQHNAMIVLKKNNILLEQESDDQQALGKTVTKLKFTPMLIKLHMSIRAYEIKWDNLVAMATGIVTSYLLLV